MRSRWLYLSYFVVLSIPGRFIPIFYTLHSQTPLQIGLLSGVAPLIALISIPLLSGLSDSTNQPILITAITQAISALFYFLQLIALPSFHLLPSYTRFPILLTLRILFGFFAQPISVLLCAISITQLQQLHGGDGHQEFGRERLWGAVSWALTSLVLGFLLDSPISHALVFYVSYALSSLMFLVTLYTFARLYCQQTKHLSSAAENASIAANYTAIANTEDSSPQSHSVLTTARFVLTAGGSSTLFYFVLIFVLQSGMSIVENLLFIYLRNELSASNFICGISVVITVIFEIPLFAMAPYLLSTLRPPLLTIVGSLAYTIRTIGYTHVPRAWMILLLEPLHGVTFAANYSASVAFVAERAPGGRQASAQAVLNVVRMLAYSIGTVIGGWVFEVYGAAFLYQGAGFVVLVATVAFAVAQWCVPKMGDVGYDADGLDAQSR